MFDLAFIIAVASNYTVPAGGNRNTSGTLNNQGTNGYHWSSSASNASNGYNLNFNSGAANYTNSNNRGNGFTVRCVAEL